MHLERLLCTLYWPKDISLKVIYMIWASELRSSDFSLSFLLKRKHQSLKKIYVIYFPFWGTREKQLRGFMTISDFLVTFKCGMLTLIHKFGTLMYSIKTWKFFQCDGSYFSRWWEFYCPHNIRERGLLQVIMAKYTHKSISNLSNWKKRSSKKMLLQVSDTVANVNLTVIPVIPWVSLA